MLAGEYVKKILLFRTNKIQSIKMKVIELSQHNF